ncbi:YidC/Oxa1 family membrane protein insertase [Clostridium sp. 'deep sea']|jgi:YidC/Oxa1 family membrane protein insertase|uniref:YidC/Oxa1 family membrane protein insertase n=1 Tax=Clostridium sp. 'deep sea' TaxID=2779445 RepID=UPI0018969B1B|nr:YidC/Oxa1 family membrane protein insertase [Clostridium sp. 'deep sea']QOR34106.1 YidC/Oxa1 family membrane protein insertase [Clostridium sp. 'deep sea']
MGFLSNIVLSIVDFFYGVTKNYGVSIILLTLTVRFALLPLNIKSMKFTHISKVLNPKMQEIQKKYKNDKEKLNQATLELWQKYKVNPAAGCLPLFIQFPILIAVITALRSPDFFKVAQPMFLGINLKLPDTGYAWAFGIKYLILPILSVVTTYLQTKVTSAGNPQANMKSMTIMMTIMMGWITISYPSGIALYWVTGNIFAIVQYMVFNRIMDGKDLLPEEGVKDSEKKRN